jgi:hypothetical protein
MINKHHQTARRNISNDSRNISNGKRQPANDQPISRADRGEKSAIYS